MRSLFFRPGFEQGTALMAWVHCMASSHGNGKIRGVLSMPAAMAPTVWLCFAIASHDTADTKGVLGFVP